MRPTSKTHNVEAMLIEYLDEVRAIKDVNSQLVIDVADIDNRMKNTVQKVGIVKYNTFDDVGGDLSYAIAMLDSQNNGVVFNSMYFRDGCYTYGKEVVDGKCTGKASDEEKQAVQKALESLNRPVNTAKKGFFSK